MDSTIKVTALEDIPPYRFCRYTRVRKKAKLFDSSKKKRKALIGISVQSIKRGQKGILYIGEGPFPVCIKAK